MNRKLGGNKWTAEIVCIAFVLGGAWLSIYGLVELNRAGKSPDWPSVTGKVVSMASGSGSSYDLMYTYEIDGQTFKGNQVSFSRLLTKDDTRRVLREYPEGKTVDVCYDPANPKISVLEPGIRPGTYSMPGFGLFFMLASSGFLFLHRKMRRRHLGPDSATQGKP